MISRRSVAIATATLLLVAVGIWLANRNHKPVAVGWEPPTIEQDLEALRALGYVDFSTTPADLSKNGVIPLRPADALPGYYLYDMTGRQRGAGG